MPGASLTVVEDDESDKESVDKGERTLHSLWAMESCFGYLAIAPEPKALSPLLHQAAMMRKRRKKRWAETS